ncbi:polyamine aminopropyltransferase [Paracoccaceae bacterium]|nr:polyamine aminopropyltransferase [Paracoccaceae bacterium]
MYGQPSFIEDVHSIYTLKGSKAFQGFEINRTLFEGKSQYQDIAIYENDSLGRVLTLDGIIQITECDEFVYQEMMAHVPIFSHENPENVLIIGGGDGGILREVLRHKGIKRIVMVEIDQMVIDACVEYMPIVNDAGKVYRDSRTQLIVGDAFAFVKDTDLKFDVVIIDSTDPIGPGAKLFSYEFYESMNKILKLNALVSTQGGVPQFQPGEVGTTLSCLEDAGLHASCYIAAVPTYYGGYMTLGFGAHNSTWSLPDLETLDQRFRETCIKTKHYSPAMHLASFVLPPWIQDDINNKRKKKGEVA